jgi:WD40 repeat protein
MSQQNMLSKRQGTELSATQAKRHHNASMQRVSIAMKWLRAGPVHIQGVLDIISAFSQEFEGICLFALEGHSRPISALAALPNGKLASGSWDKTVRVWDVASGACLLTLAGHAAYVIDLAVLPDGKLASCSWDKTVRVWDVVSGACLLTLAGHTDYVNTLAVLLDGKLASGSSSHDNNIRVWC